MKPSGLVTALALVLATVAGASFHAQVAQNQADYYATLASALTEYKNARNSRQVEAIAPTCDKVIQDLQGLAQPSEGQLRQLLTAYELRGRIRFHVNQEDRAREDYEAILMRQPAYAYGSLTREAGGEVSSESAKVFQTVKDATIGTLALTVSPGDAEVTFRGSPLPREQWAGVQLPKGVYPLGAKKQMFASRDIEVTVTAGTTTGVNMTLERVASAVGIVTVPARVRVSLDGEYKGTTEAVPIPQPYAKSAELANLPADYGFLEIKDVPTGNPSLQYRRDCYQDHQRPFAIDRPADYAVLTRLTSAAAILKVTGSGGVVYVDGERKGAVEYTGELCPGSDRRVIEVRSARGRQILRVDPVAAETISVVADPKPAIAILAQHNVPADVKSDLRQRVEEAFRTERSESITFFAADQEAAAAAVKIEQLSNGWLALPKSNAALLMNSDQRVRASKNLSRKLEVQGVAEINVTDLAQRKIALTYLADGSGVPETIDILLDDARDLRMAVEKLNKKYPVMRVSAGLETADVEAVTGALVLRRVWNLGGALNRGDVIISVDGNNVGSASDFDERVAKRKAGDVLALQVKAPNGVVRPVQLTLAEFPVSIWPDDETLLVNKLILDFRLATTEAPVQHQSSARLNLAVALMKAKNWEDARRELEKIQMPDLNDGEGISRGTIQYYLGLCLDELRLTAEADRAYTAAMQSRGAWLREGTLVEPLAKEKLADPSRKR